MTVYTKGEDSTDCSQIKTLSEWQAVSNYDAETITDDYERESQGQTVTVI